MDNQRESPSTRNQDPHRAKPIRSQTQQTVRSVDHFSILRFGEYSLSLSSHPSNGRPVLPPRRSLSQDSTPVPPVPEKSKSSKRGKKGSTHADVIDRLDFSGVGPSTSSFLSPPNTPSGLESHD